MIRAGLLLMFSVLLLPDTMAAQDESTLAGDGIPATLYQTVNVRSGPDTRFDIVGQVTEGDTVFVTGREGEASQWLQARLPDGVIGWIPSFYLIFEADPSGLPVVDPDGESAGEGAGVTITAYGQVNVRSGPSIAYDIVGQLDVNDSAPALARSNPQNDWLYIESSDVTGWVAYFTVTVQGDPNQLPVRVPDATGSDLVAPDVLVRTRFNTRLRTEASIDSESVGVVPFDSQVTPLARSEDDEWLYVAYGDVTGWAALGLFDIPEDHAAALPLYSPDVDYRITPVAPTAEGGQDEPDTADTPAPEVTAEAEATPEATEA